MLLQLRGGRARDTMLMTTSGMRYSVSAGVRETEPEVEHLEGGIFSLDSPSFARACESDALSIEPGRDADV